MSGRFGNNVWMNKISDYSFTNRYDMIEIQEKRHEGPLEERQLIFRYSQTYSTVSLHLTNLEYLKKINMQ